MSEPKLTPQEQFALEQKKVSDELDADHKTNHKTNHPDKWTEKGNPREKYRAPGSVHDKNFTKEQNERRAKKK